MLKGKFVLPNSVNVCTVDRRLQRALCSEVANKENVKIRWRNNDVISLKLKNTWSIMNLIIYQFSWDNNDIDRTNDRLQRPTAKVHVTIVFAYVTIVFDGCLFLKVSYTNKGHTNNFLPSMIFTCDLPRPHMFSLSPIDKEGMHIGGKRQGWTYWQLTRDALALGCKLMMSE